jgi:hypothetical protein
MRAFKTNVANAFITTQSASQSRNFQESLPTRKFMKLAESKKLMNKTILWMNQRKILDYNHIPCLSKFVISLWIQRYLSWEDINCKEANWS